jgi:hypothetical protein
MVNLVNPSCPWLVLTPKVLQLCINHFMLVLCKPMWVNKACQIFLVPSRSSSTPLYPPKCCKPGSVPRLLVLLLFFVWDSHLSPSRSQKRIKFRPLLRPPQQACPWTLSITIEITSWIHQRETSMFIKTSFAIQVGRNLGHRWDLLNKLIWECP